MKISEGIEHFYNYQRLNVKKNTLRNYEFILDDFQNHIGDKGIKPEDRIFPITYAAAARIIVKKAGDLVGIHLKPHDLRTRAATYASRAGRQLEIVSKVLLRHSNLSITQMYLGKISDVEAMRWIENLHR